MGMITAELNWSAKVSKLLRIMPMVGKHSLGLLFGEHSHFPRIKKGKL